MFDHDLFHRSLVRAETPAVWAQEQDNLTCGTTCAIMQIMSNFVSELKQRLDRCRDEKGRLLPRLKALEIEEHALRTLIDAEERRQAEETDAPLPAAAGKSDLLATFSFTPSSHFAATSPMRQAVIAALADGRPRGNDEIVEAVAKMGTAPTDVPLGRSVQGTLLSLSHQGVVRRVSQGVWQLEQGNTPSE